MFAPPDAAKQAQLAVGVIEAVDVALADKAITANSLYNRGELLLYTGTDRGGKVPFFMNASMLAYMQLDNCAGLKHMISAYGADVNIRYEMYEYPHIYSVTPLHAAVKFCARDADAWGMEVDAATMARVLIEAGADPDARCEIVASLPGGTEQPAVAYKGPPFSATAAMMLAAPPANIADKTGPVGLRMLEALLTGGASMDALDGRGKSIRQQELLTEQAKELLDRLAPA